MITTLDPLKNTVLAFPHPDEATMDERSFNGGVRGKGKPLDRSKSTKMRGSLKSEMWN